jgi:hypothetical protein
MQSNSQDDETQGIERADVLRRFSAVDFAVAQKQNRWPAWNADPLFVSSSVSI